MKLFFVIDIMDGIVVRGYKGERESYKPINLFSKVVGSSDPVRVVESLKPKYLYVADLDKIMSRGNNLDLIISIKDRVKELMLDYGFNKPDDVFYSISPVLGTETFDIRNVEKVEHEKVYVSLDLKENGLLDASNSFKDWRNALEFLNTYKLKGIIILTLHKVGTSQSLDFKILEKAIEFSENAIYAGGGVKNMDDLFKAKNIVCKGVLNSTAIHNGNLPLELIRKGEL